MGVFTEYLTFHQLYRVYCTGSFVNKETSRIPSMITGSTYDVATLKELAVAHGRDIASCK